MPSVIERGLRIALCCAAIAGAVWALGLRAEARRCDDEQAVLFHVVFLKGSDPATVRKVLSDCRDPGRIARMSAGLAEADPRVARLLARHAVAEAPDTFAPWAALVIASGPGSPETRAAWQRARRLNPRWPVPAPAAR